MVNNWNTHRTINVPHKLPKKQIPLIKKIHNHSLNEITKFLPLKDSDDCECVNIYPDKNLFRQKKLQLDLKLSQQMPKQTKHCIQKYLISVSMLITCLAGPRQSNTPFAHDIGPCSHKLYLRSISSSFVCLCVQTLINQCFFSTCYECILNALNTERQPIILY